MIKIAQLSCGTEYSAVQSEIEAAANAVGAKMVYPDVDMEKINAAVDRFGFNPVSPQLKLMIARAMALADKSYEADAVFISSCFRCAEAALVRTELRKFIQNNTRMPVVTYSFTERTKSGQLLTRMEALVTIVERKELLARERQVGLTAGLDSGSSTTKAVIMRDNVIIGKSWTPTADIFSSAETVLQEALTQAGVTMGQLEAIGTTGYGRFTLGKKFHVPSNGWKIAAEAVCGQIPQEVFGGIGNPEEGHGSPFAVKKDRVGRGKPIAVRPADTSRLDPILGLRAQLNRQGSFQGRPVDHHVGNRGALQSGGQFEDRGDMIVAGKDEASGKGIPLLEAFSQGRVIEIVEAVDGHGSLLPGEMERAVVGHHEFIPFQDEWKTLQVICGIGNV